MTKTIASYVPANTYGKGYPGTGLLQISGVIAAATNLDRFYVPPAFIAPRRTLNGGAAMRIADIQAFYQVAAVGSPTGVDTYTLNRVTVGGSVILIATITMTSLQVSAPISVVSGGKGVALYPGEYLRLDCTAIATYATSQPSVLRCQFSYEAFGIIA